MRNRLANVHNRYQNFTKYRRVLCICSAGLLRSPTMAYVLSQDPYNHNTRAAGIDAEFALVPVDLALLEWAEELVFAEQEHYNIFDTTFDLVEENYENIKILNIPDEYDYRDPELIQLIRERYD